MGMPFSDVLLSSLGFHSSQISAAHPEFLCVPGLHRPHAQSF
uniref:Uncharacterized protein n=1 Tax=Anguilla anguilla TaxID=7936 RepID=A0A0E9RSB6_ANGAN